MFSCERHTSGLQNQHAELRVSLLQPASRAESRQASADYNYVKLIFTHSCSGLIIWLEKMCCTGEYNTSIILQKNQERWKFGFMIHCCFPWTYLALYPDKAGRYLQWDTGRYSDLPLVFKLIILSILLCSLFLELFSKK